MASTQGELIMQAIVNALNNVANDPPLQTVRNRPRPMAVENADGTPGLDSILFYAVKEEVNRESRNLVRRTRTVRFEIPVAGPPPLDSAADPLVIYVVNTLYGSTAVMQACKWLEEKGIVWETESSYEDASVCLLEMEFAYITGTDPTVSYP